MTNYPTKTAINKQEDRMSLRWGSFSSVFLRYALGLGFFSAVADRFGLWGAFGQPNVEWGKRRNNGRTTHHLHIDA